jgi:hypothetical protein
MPAGPFPDSLVEARLVPPGRRRAWERELVRFQIDEINSVYDGLALHYQTDVRQELLSRARQRIDRVLQAARWMEVVFRREVRAAVREGFDETEDGFGPAILLSVLGRPHPVVEDWLGRLPAPVTGLMAELGYDGHLRRKPESAK